MAAYTLTAHDGGEQMKIQDQAVTLCFSTPIWRFEFSDFAPVNAAIRDELAQLGWNKLDDDQRTIVHPYHEFSPRLLPGKTDPITRSEITFKAGEGSMLIFPGWPPHKVARNNSDRRRVSVSLNSI